MKKLVMMLVVFCLAGAALAAPSLEITSPPVINNGWTGPMIDPPASQGQWFMRITSGEEEARTHEFYDNSIELGCGGGGMDCTAIEGYAFNMQYDGLNNLIYFEVNATITNDTPGEGEWADGSNSHGESLSTPEQYEGTLYDTKLTVEFAIERFSFDNWFNNLMGPMNAPYFDIEPHIVAVEPNQLGWYCWTPGNPEELMPWGDYLVPTYDFGDIPPWQSANRILKFTVDPPGLPMGDPRRMAIESGQDIFLNRTTSLKISTWIDMVAIDNWMCYPDEAWRSSDVSVFHNIIGPEPEKPKWVQLPDLDVTGIDIMATVPYILADDFECNETTLITEITVWGSWNDDVLPENDAGNVEFTLSIHRDIPVSEQNPYSKPGVVDWYRTFYPGEFTVVIERDQIDEGWMRPDDPGSYIFPGDHICWKYTFQIPPEKAFCQQGTLEEPIVYWLDVQAMPLGPDMTEFGWKTSLDHWNDDAVWGMGFEPYTGFWEELIYPPQHDMAGQSIDLAFAIDGNLPCLELEPKNDLGDAPDSTNNFLPPMTAYPGPGIMAQFPTVYLSAGSPPYGPIHIHPAVAFYLGMGVSLEDEADIGLDQDGINNLDVIADSPDHDDFDDGVAMPLYLPRCRMVTIDYTVTVLDITQPIFANVWFDWNRDGDWDDIAMCELNKPADEWAVQDQALGFSAPGTYTVRTPPFRTYDNIYASDMPEIWMRITLSDTPWNSSGSGGSGPSGGYVYGETEDYFFMPDTSCWDCADFDLSGQVNLYDLDTLTESWLWMDTGNDFREADLDCDGDIQLDDFAILANQWLLACP